MTALAVKRPTQGELILRVLADGRWHTHAEILRAVPCILHSRVASINDSSRKLTGRNRIEHRGSGGGSLNHEYRLLVSSPPPLDGKPSRSQPVADSGVASQGFPSSGLRSSPAVSGFEGEPVEAKAARTPKQLSVFAA